MDPIFLTLLFIFTVLISLYLGYVFGIYTYIKYLTKVYEGIVKNAKSMFQTIEMRIEDSDGMFYAYDKETNEFIAQGKTKTDLINEISEKFENTSVNKSFNVSQEDLELLNERI